jgi:RNA polymerase sigma factor (sigma-70 family)
VPITSITSIVSARWPVGHESCVGVVTLRSALRSRGEGTGADEGIHVRHPGGTSSRVAVARIGADPEAFESFYREHVEAMLRYATRRARDPHTAADLVADIFLAAIDASGGYREELGTPIAWLYGIARNVVASEERRAARTLSAESRVAGRRLLDGDDIARLEERIDAERHHRSLLERIATLPAGQQAVLEAIAVDGLTLAEAAKALGISTVTARVRLHRARRTLREKSMPDSDTDMDTHADADADSLQVPRSVAALMEAQ